MVSITDPRRRFNQHQQGKGGYPRLRPRRQKGKGNKSPYSQLPYVGIVSKSIDWTEVQVHENTSRLTGVKTIVNSNYGTNRTSSLTEVRTFARNVDWKQKLAKGFDVSSGYSRTGGIAVPATYQCSSLSSNIASSGYGAVLGSVYTGVLVDEVALSDLALTRFKRRLNGHVGAASLAPPLAESREIHGLVRQINELLIEMYGTLIRAKRTGGRSVGKLAGNIWLMFGFGINPLLGDAATAAKAIAAYVVRRDKAVRISATASQDWVAGGPSNGRDACNGVTVQVQGAAKNAVSYRYTGAVDIKVAAGSDYDVLDHLGLTMSDLPSAFWELTAFSWAVDYFVTVSPWLDDVFYTLPGQLKYLVRTRRQLNECRHTLKFSEQFSNTKIVSAQSQPGYSQFYSFSRTPLATLPTRQLRIKSVDEVAKYGVTKVLNLASVLAGRHL